MTDLIVVPQVTEWQRLKGLVLDSVSSPITRRVYNLGLHEFLEWYGREPRPGFTKATVCAWRVALEARGLGTVSINVRITAVRKLAVEAAAVNRIPHQFGRPRGRDILCGPHTSCRATATAFSAASLTLSATNHSHTASARSLSAVIPPTAIPPCPACPTLLGGSKSPPRTSMPSVASPLSSISISGVSLNSTHAEKLYP